MPLGMDVGLSPDDFVLDGDPAPLPKKGEAPNFWSTSVVAKRLHGFLIGWVLVYGISTDHFSGPGGAIGPLSVSV